MTFTGDNDLSLPRVEAETGACRDGLHQDRRNENRGGESVVSYLLSVVDMHCLLRTCEARADEMEAALRGHQPFTPLQRRLVGAYFLHEYSFEAAALFNPSMVPHPDQSRAVPGTQRFILSLRAVGEGHVSSLTFRAGTIAADGSVHVDPTARLAATPTIRARVPGTHGETVDVAFEPNTDISERVIFPITEARRAGSTTRPTPPIAAGRSVRS